MIKFITIKFLNGYLKNKRQNGLVPNESIKRFTFRIGVDVTSYRFAL